MRVLAITPLYPPYSRVGAWLATHLFLRHLVQREHEVSAFSVGYHRLTSWQLDGVTVHSGKRGRSFASELARQADVLVAHAGETVGAEVAEVTGRPLVVMVHGAGYQHIGTADLAVFNSENLRALSGWDGPSIVCHPPTDPADHKVTVTGDHVTLVNLSEPKGVKVAWRIAEAMPDVPFLGVKGGYGYQIVPRAENFTTMPVQADMRQVWAQTRVLLMPSAHETWGMVGVEAMCSGIPVIAHPTPGLQESLGAAGIFVDRDDTDGWVRELRRLDDPTEYATASTAARERVAELIPEMKAGLDRFAAAVETLCR